MNSTDQAKICDVGFTIIRDRDIHSIVNKIELLQTLEQTKIIYEIWAKDKNHLSWFKLSGPYNTKAARERNKKYLLKDQKYIED
ncbi:hypothetical protein ES703_105660 [subsurface metagenome]